jgi:hypothetical protein
MRKTVTMTSPVGRQSRRNDSPTPQLLVISVGIIVFAAVVLVCAALLAVPLWTALVADWQVEAISDRCAAVGTSAPFAHSCALATFIPHI